MNRFGFRGMLALSMLAVAALVVALIYNQPKSSWLGANSGKTLVVYCAAGLQPPLSRILAEYEAAYNVRFETKFAGSGALLSDIRVGGGDLFLAADRDYLNKAVKMDLVRETVPIAYQHPVIVVRKGNPKSIAKLDDLLRSDVRLALSDPKVAAIGKVVSELLGKDGRWEPLWKKALIHCETVNQVANDVKLKAADAGIVWDATAVQYAELEMIAVPVFEKSKNEIAVGVLSASRQPTRALHFARYLTAPDKGLRAFRNEGYHVVEGDEWAESPEIQLFSGALNRPAVEPTLKAFEEREGVRILTAFNGCGVLVGQMRTGIRPDVYFACDRSFMHMVNDLFLDASDVSRTDMVIITRKGNPRGIHNLEDLARDGLKLALCDANKSALGKLTDDLLTRHGLLEKVRRNVQASSATADNLVQQIVVGGLDAAIVYRANTTFQTEQLDVISLQDPTAFAVQPIAVGRASKHRYLAERLRERVLSNESRLAFDRSGFEWAAGSIEKSREKSP